MKYFFIFLLRIYKYFVSPLLGPRCRFHPSCSAYSLECFQKFPIYKALWYSTVRICKCHPFHTGGHDPVPDK